MTLIVSIAALLFEVSQRSVSKFASGSLWYWTQIIGKDDEKSNGSLSYVSGRFGSDCL